MMRPGYELAVDPIELDDPDDLIQAIRGGRAIGAGHASDPPEPIMPKPARVIAQRPVREWDTPTPPPPNQDAIRAKRRIQRARYRERLAAEMAFWDARERAWAREGPRTPEQAAKPTIPRTEPWFPITTPSGAIYRWTDGRMWLEGTYAEPLAEVIAKLKAEGACGKAEECEAGTCPCFAIDGPPPEADPRTADYRDL